MAVLSSSLCFTVAVCSATAHIAIPIALFLAFSSLGGAVFLGVVTAVFLIGIGVCAAVVFGLGAIVWTITSSFLLTNTDIKKVSYPVFPSHKSITRRCYKGDQQATALASRFWHDCSATARGLHGLLHFLLALERSTLVILTIPIAWHLRVVSVASSSFLSPALTIRLH